MRTSKKTQQTSGQAELILAIKALAGEKEISEEVLFTAIEEALKAAEEKGIHGKDTTPFLLAKVKELTGDASFKANVRLALNNAKAGAKVAYHLSKLSEN